MDNGLFYPTNNPIMKENITIAIADDSPLMRKSVCSFLKQMGFEVVIEAENANDLLQQLQQSEVLPQVCLLDYKMPRMNGAELAALLNQQYPEIKLAALTTENSLSCMVDMISNGCTAYFIKNGDPTEWHSGIRQLVIKGHYFTEWMQQALLNFIKVNSEEINRMV